MWHCNVLGRGWSCSSILLGICIQDRKDLTLTLFSNFLSGPGDCNGSDFWVVSIRLARNLDPCTCVFLKCFDGLTTSPNDKAHFFVRYLKRNGWALRRAPSKPSATATATSHSPFAGVLPVYDHAVNVLLGALCTLRAPFQRHLALQHPHVHLPSFLNLYVHPSFSSDAFDVFSTFAYDQPNHAIRDPRLYVVGSPSWSISTCSRTPKPTCLHARWPSPASAVLAHLLPKANGFFWIV
mmetsp:Transcript_23559/g.30788  ORF Transcript_23559/g.30788 Transcript_23559/m.30788 type:complete len:238 (-) Transcript_23559:482-1195(-)